MDDLRLRSLAAREGDATHEAILGDLKAVWSALPAIVKEDSDGHIAKLMSAVRMPTVLPDGTIKVIEFPDFDTSPVHHPNGGGHSYTHPVKKDDEGVALFLSRPQDLWHQKGGVQDPIDARADHLSDSRWIPGGRSDPRKLNPPPSKSSAQMRSDDGNHVSDVNKDQGITHASTKKHLVNVAGSNGTGTVHLFDKILKNAPKVLINCIQADQFPPPGDSFANRKKIATTSAGATGPKAKDISSIMSGVLSGGIGSLLANPTAAAGGSLSSTITAAVSSVTAAVGSGAAAPVVSALTGGGGLSDALGALQTGASALSGATSPAGGAFGLADVLSHAQGLTQFFGDTPPPAVALPAVIAPLDPGNISSVETQLNSTIAQVVALTMTPGVAGGVINGYSAQLNALMTAANAALTALQTAAPALQLAQLAGSLGFSLDPNEAAVGAAISNPNLAALNSAMAQIFVATAEDAAAIAAFPDPGQDGARGAF